MRITKLLLAVALLHLVPIAAWAAFKPIRVIAPEWLGLHCSAQGVCVDNLAHMPEAEALKREAVEFVNAQVGRIQTPPRAIFCSTDQCAKDFGFTHQGAYNVGTFGLVISPRGWQPHFVRHELIHHLQNERLGSLNAWIFKPNWLLEGMAYSRSQDPRHPLPEPLQGWRMQFEKWEAEIGARNLWQAAALVR